ncbi:MAG: NUDIX hydrolase [Caldilineaceae bacterium]|nr:NUDIX hydrolase [Caldilineaceae bacterium]
MADPQPWQTVDTRTAFSNRWTRVLLDDVVLPDGRRYEYTRLEPGGIGVAVIGFNAQGEVLLEREYRHGVGQVIWQLPGGWAARDEELQTAGLRELLEETGYAPQVIDAEHVRYLGVVWDNPGFGPAQSHVYAAWGLTEVQATRRDPAEFVTLHWQPVRWLREAVRSGEIQDRVVVAAVALLLLNGWLE